MTRFKPLLLCLLLLAGPAAADVVALKPDHPDRYTVVKGDTLWDISARFLRDPWLWASVWTINPQVRNPHLIYPGDIIYLTYVDGRPQLGLVPPGQPQPPPPPPPSGGPSGEPQDMGTETITEVLPSGVVKLRPRLRTETLTEAIPTISPGVIGPFLSKPLAVGRRELDGAGYVAVGQDGRLALGDGSVFYARGLREQQGEYFQVFRPGNALRHPETGETLAYEAYYLGEAQLLTPGDPSKMVLTRVTQEIVPGDRLLAAPRKASLPYYYPSAPKTQVHGRILASLNGLREFGPTAIVAISLGEREGMAEGNVLRIMRHVGDARDPYSGKNFALPDEDSGLLMVFRVYEKVSYALIMSANRPIRLYDAVYTP